MGVIFGFAVGWVSLASDCNVYQPAETPAWKTFAWTYGGDGDEGVAFEAGDGCARYGVWMRAVDEDEDGTARRAELAGIALHVDPVAQSRPPPSLPFVFAGLIFPLVLIQWLSAAIMCVAGGPAPSNDAWAAAYAADELGGLLGAVLVPAYVPFLPPEKGGMLMSCGADVYSMGLSISVIGVWLAKVPRLIWPIVITAIYIPIAIAGANSFSSSLEDFMNVLGYWLSIFVVVVLLEHFDFRKGDWAQYNAAETWNRQDKTPVGIAALVAFLFGTLGTAMGMAQIWYIGKIGALVGGSANPFGGDIGFELSGAFAGIVYLPARYLELKYIGR
ncbi:hypothetical protein B0H13DRAFT_2463399 [Mycena leptocephala]|nr:hypothetical protein B0H13DRAFT_2463399 [Mycena leptocephala]